MMLFVSVVFLYTLLHQVQGILLVHSDEICVGIKECFNLRLPVADTTAF